MATAAFRNNVMMKTRRTARPRTRATAAIAAASVGAAQSSELFIGETRSRGSRLEGRGERTSPEGREATAGLAGRRGQALVGIGAREHDAGRDGEVAHGPAPARLLHIGEPDWQRDLPARGVVRDGLEVVAAHPDAAEEVGREPEEPGVPVIGRGARLSSGGGAGPAGPLLPSRVAHSLSFVRFT